MFVRRRRHSALGLNATSMADVSFMLLTFFLVTTTMDSDKGLINRLPPADNSQRDEATVVTRERLMMFRITADNQLLLNDSVVSTNSLRSAISAFIISHRGHHTIAIDSDPAASYDVYFRLQNEIAAAYAAVRDEMAQQRYGKTFRRCSPNERDAILKACPQQLVELYDSEEGGVDDAH